MSPPDPHALDHPSSTLSSAQFHALVRPVPRSRPPDSTLSSAQFHALVRPIPRSCAPASCIRPTPCSRVPRSRSPASRPRPRPAPPPLSAPAPCPAAASAIGAPSHPASAVVRRDPPPTGSSITRRDSRPCCVRDSPATTGPRPLRHPSTSPRRPLRHPLRPAATTASLATRHDQPRPSASNPTHSARSTGPRPPHVPTPTRSPPSHQPGPVTSVSSSLSSAIPLAETPTACTAAARPLPHRPAPTNSNIWTANDSSRQSAICADRARRKTMRGRSEQYRNSTGTVPISGDARGARDRDRGRQAPRHLPGTSGAG
jgi:hypothetical protein